jgi:hypothetical protein
MLSCTVSFATGLPLWLLYYSVDYVAKQVGAFTISLASNRQ